MSLTELDVQCRVHQSPVLDPVLNTMTPVQSSHVIYFRYILIMCNFLGYDVILVNRRHRFVGILCLLFQCRRLKLESESSSETFLPNWRCSHPRRCILISNSESLKYGTVLKITTFRNYSFVIMK
jgi:hypothetical protein